MTGDWLIFQERDEGEPRFRRRCIDQLREHWIVERLDEQFGRSVDVVGFEQARVSFGFREDDVVANSLPELSSMFVVPFSRTLFVFGDVRFEAVEDLFQQRVRLDRRAHV